MKNKVTKHPGVWVRNKIVWIDFYIDSVRFRESLGIPPTKTNLTLAANLLGSIKVDHLMGVFDPVKRFPNCKNLEKYGLSFLSNLTIEEAVTKHIENLSSSEVKERTKTLYLAASINHMFPYIGDKVVAKITSGEINTWIGELDQTGKQKNNILTPLRGMFRQAYKLNNVKNNPMDKVDSFTVIRNEPNPLLSNEIDKILNVIAPDFRDYYQVGIWTGLRSGEQITLRWEDIDFDEMTIHVCRAFDSSKKDHIGLVKGSKKGRRKERYIDILAPAYEALKRQFKITGKDNGFVFINQKTGGMYKYDILSTPWNNALITAKLTKRVPYQTRHTYASVMLSIGMPLTWLKEQMGHSSYKMLEDNYARWLHRDKNVIQWAIKKTKGKKNSRQFESFFLDIRK